MNKFLAALISGIVLLASSCSSPQPYTPSPNRPFEEIPEFTTTSAVSLINAQPSTEQVDMGAGLLANYNAWTDVAIQILERELIKRGAKTAAGGDKTIKVAITGVRFGSGFMRTTTEVNVRVETGDGFVGLYAGVNSSAVVVDIPRQIDGAMMRLVVEILKDPKIVAYLK